MSDGPPRDPQSPGFTVHFDCRHYSGYKPCGINPVCEGCEHHDPVGRRVLIIKFAAMGDVLRTTPVLPAIRRLWPDAHVTWVTAEVSADLLRGNPLIDRLLVHGPDTTLLLEAMEFDSVFNFEKDLAALALGERVQARERRGFRLTSAGTVGIADERAGEALRLGIDDEMKFHQNTKSVQQIACEMVGLEWGAELYVFEPSETSRAKRDQFIAQHPETREKTAVAVCTGCGPGFPTKRWGRGNALAMLEKLERHADTVPVLCGGERETELNRGILAEAGAGVIDAGCDNSFDEFAGVLMACDAVVTADSMPMHLAVALGKRVVAMFGPTTPREVDLGPLGEMVVTDADCHPCYLTRCDKTPDGRPLCMEEMGADVVFEALERVLARPS